jgi:hypothetical protein
LDRSPKQVVPSRSPVRVLVAVLGAVVVLALAGAALAGGAGAQEPQPTWSMPAEMQPGEQTTVTGEGFQPGATVTMTGPGNVVLGEAVADEFGRISMTMTVPGAMVSGPAVMTMVGANIGGQVMTLTKTVNIGTLVTAPAAPAMPMDPQFTG